MDFKHINDKHKTPKTEISILSKRISDTVTCDSPFRSMPNFSTPPSRFSKIFNPFETHLIDRLHLPTFSPSVFAQVSTPKNEGNFKWTIDDISSLKPADIDETTVSQHVATEDPHIESLVQQKIDTFFNEKAIVPSPMNEKVTSVPLLKDCGSETPSPQRFIEYSNSSAQTVLTLPPVLPQHIEDILKPFFTFTQDQQENKKDTTEESNIKDQLLYRQLFEFDHNPQSPVMNDIDSRTSSPALSTGLSPIQLSPFNIMDKHSEGCDMPELKECDLSPISISRNPSGKSSPFSTPPRSLCRLSFSASRTSMDVSMTVPEMDNQSMSQSVCLFKDDSFSPVKEILSDSTVNWDMEYNNMSLISRGHSPHSEHMDVSNSNTPHSKIFISQRKRLSDSFKDEENFRNLDDYEYKENVPERELNRSKLFRNDTTDAGYQTQGAIFSEDSSSWSSNVFASTPSKH